MSSDDDFRKASDDMFNGLDPRYYINPYNPLDPSTPYGADETSALKRNLHLHRVYVREGWPTILVFALVALIYFMAAIWRP